MTTIRIPTPLRPYTGGSKEVDVTGGTVGAALVDLSARYPDVRRHLFDDAGGLRPYVNVFLNDEDIRTLQAEATPLQSADRLMIVPSIAGGTAESQGVPVDHAALRANQASIILLLVAAFVLNATWLVAVVALVMLTGTALGRPGFLWVYLLLRKIGPGEAGCPARSPSASPIRPGAGRRVPCCRSGGCVAGRSLAELGAGLAGHRPGGGQSVRRILCRLRAVLLAASPRPARVPRRTTPVHLPGTAAGERPMIERLLIAAGLIAFGLLVARLVTAPAPGTTSAPRARPP